MAGKGIALSPYRVGAGGLVLRPLHVSSGMSYQSLRRARLEMTVTSSASSTGLGTCI
jgi:hypothetical protein